MPNYLPSGCVSYFVNSKHCWVFFKTEHFSTFTFKSIKCKCSPCFLITKLSETSNFNFDGYVGVLHDIGRLYAAWESKQFIYLSVRPSVYHQAHIEYIKYVELK